LNKKIEKIVIYKVSEVELGENISVLSVPSFSKLKQLAQDVIFETGNDFLVLEPGKCYRYRKPTAEPKILKALSIEMVMPAANFKINVSVQDLKQWALRYDVTLVETSDSFLLPSPDLMLIAKKENNSSTM
jgi:hypothetical protein